MQARSHGGQKPWPVAQLHVLCSRPASFVLVQSCSLKCTVFALRVAGPQADQDCNLYAVAMSELEKNHLPEPCLQC